MKPMQFATVAQMVPAFSGSAEIDVPVPLTYDFEVSTAKYFHGLEDGEIPFILLFSGTTFLDERGSLSIEQVPWNKETFEKLASGKPEQLSSRFQVTHGMLLNVLSRAHEHGGRAMRRIISASHEPEHARKQHRKRRLKRC